MSHIVIVGGGSALAQPLIRHYLDHGDTVTAISRGTDSEITHPNLSRVICQVGGGPPDYRTWESIAPPNVIITLAGATMDAKIAVMSMTAWYNVLEGTLTPVFTALHHGLRKMPDGGSVLVVGSIVGSTGAYGAANYAAAKAGLVGLVKSAALEVVKRNITVNLLELGYVNAGMGARLPDKVKERVLESIPLKRFAEPDEVVKIIDFLVRNKYMTGYVIPFAGGL